MQNFTLGRKGTNWFLFAFVLLIGSLPSFGQNCPTVTDEDPGTAGNQQTYCYLQTVADLQATANGDGVEWYRTATSTNPIPSDELLESTTYFAGNNSGTCTSREAVEVTVTNLGAPTPSFGSFFQPCEYGTNDTSTVQDLIDMVDADDPSYVIEVFDAEFSGSPLPPTQDLVEGTSYFVGQRDPAATPSCPSTRVAIQYSPVLSEAPTGDANQTLCQNSTVADLQVQATSPDAQAFRWYSTATSNPALDPSTPLVDGETYYASQIVNRTNSTLPPCESTDRFAVTVTLEQPINEAGTQSFCESTGTGNSYDVPRVEDLSPAGATWYADDVTTTPLDPQTELADGEDYFNRDNGNDCTQDRVVVELYPTPNAGMTTQVHFCNDADPVNLVDYINPSILGDPDQGGHFNPNLTGNMFDPSNYTPGTYNFTYIVDGNGNCPTDTAAVTVIVDPTPNAGPDFSTTVCSNELSDASALIDRFSAEMAGRDQGGTFTPDFQTLYAMYQNNPYDTFATTYTVTNDNTGCDDSAQLSVTVLESPYAGEDGSVQLMEGDTAVINLFDQLGGTPDTGGNWDPGNGTFDPATDTPGTFTYTVTSSNGCEDTATVTVLAPQQDCPVVSNTTQEFCESIGDGNTFHKPMISDLDPAGATWYATATSTDALPDTQELVDGENYFAGVADGSCTNRTEVIVQIDDSPNAGKTTFITVCSNEEPFDLASRMAPSILGPADPDGTFSPQLASGTTIFDPAVDASRRYTYTVGSASSCPSDSAYITVTINQAPNAGDDINESYCVTDPSQVASSANEFKALFDSNRDSGGTFDPTLDELANDFSNNPYGTFSTTYSVTANGCTDTASLSVTINQQIDANAGDDVSVEFCSAQGVQSLYDYLSNDAVKTGTFAAPYQDGNFDPSAAGTDPITVDYTVTETNSCVTGSDSATFTITVVPGPDAGENGSVTLTNEMDPVNLFDYLNGTPDMGGTWTPGNADGTLDPAGMDLGDYEYTYTISNNDCTDSAVVTVTIEQPTCPEVTASEQFFCESILTGNDSRLPQVRDLMPAGATWYATADANTPLAETTVLVSGEDYYAGNLDGTCTNRGKVTVTLDDSPNAGATTSVTVCENGDSFDILDVLNPSILGPADEGGTVSPALASGTTVFDPSVDAAGSYRYIVSSTNEACPDDEAVITIKITESAYAGEDMELDVCMNDEPVNLFEKISADADMNGEFTLDGDVITDGMMNPADYDEGTYEITYSVAASNDCGEDSSTITVNVNSVPDAPEASDMTFCAIEMPTGADLSPSGEGYTWYSDAELNTMVTEDEGLTSGEYYVTQTSDDNGCESDATMITVTVNDTDAPSIDQSMLDFCEFDEPTIADLNAAINENGAVTWYDAEEGGNALSVTTKLQNGVTYYASLTNDNIGCESSSRLSVTVELQACELVFPEGISPNGDGMNDTFVIDNIESEYPNYSLEVYNRWGNLVYKGNASTPDWDGTSNQSGTLGNDVLPTGVYFYIVEFNDGSTPAKQGKVYLSR